MSVQYTAMLHVKMVKCDIFLIFAQNIDRGYTLETASLVFVLEQKIENKKLAASKAYSIPDAMCSCWNIANPANL